MTDRLKNELLLLPVASLRSEGPRIIDEVRIGSWMHLELMRFDERANAVYHLRIADREFSLEFDRNGNATIWERGE